MLNRFKYVVYVLLLLLCTFVGYLGFPLIRPKIENYLPQLYHFSEHANINTNIASVTSKTPFYKMLDTAVKIQTVGSSGSGVIVFSEKYQDNYYAYILTNDHVTRDNKEVIVERFRYFNYRTVDLMEVFTGSVIARSTEHDLSVVEIKTSKEIASVQWLTRPEYEDTYLADRVYIGACPLANNPLLTEGRIASISSDSILVTAFAIFGSSGGAVYTENAKLLGLVNRISKYEEHGTDHAVPQLAYVIPIDVIVGWLKERQLNFLFNKNLDLFSDYVHSRESKKHF